MRLKFCTSLLVTTLLLISAHNAMARTTRDLVFEDSDDATMTQKVDASKIPNAQILVIKATLELNRNGQISTVLPTHEFVSGDKVRIVYTPNTDGYVYWLAKGSSGSYSILFPSVQAGTDNKVNKNQEYTIPAKGTFRFDDKPGQEELLCVLSAQPVPELEQAVAEASGGKIQPAQATQVAQLEEKHTSQRTTRDLVFEDEDAADVNTKSQVAAKGEPFVAYYLLKHQ